MYPHPRVTLARSVVAEFLGTGLLVAAVVGSGIMAQRLTNDVALQLLANAAATVGVLYGLILMFGPLSGAHFNPIVSLVGVMRGEHSWSRVLAYVPAQVLGGCLGAAVANLMFDEAAWQQSTKVRDGGGIWLGEVVATAGLLLVIVLIGNSRAAAVPSAGPGPTSLGHEPSSCCMRRISSRTVAKYDSQSSAPAVYMACTP